MKSSNNNTNGQIDQYKKMTETPVSRLILALGIPTIISMLVTSIYNVADTYFVSSIGTSASGAVGIIFGLQAVMQAFGFMFGHGAGSIISRKLGQKDTHAASKFASTSFFLSFTIGLFITIIGFTFMRPFMRLLGSTETILPYSIAYGKYILIAAPFFTSSCVLNNILRYEGQAAYAMIGLTAGGILNIFGDPLFMFVFHMGISGAGISTMISQIISFILLFIMFFNGKTQSRIRFNYITRNITDIANIINTGLASLIRQGLNSVSTMILNNQAAIYGDAAVAGMSIVNRVTFFIFAVGLGIGQGYQPVAAFNFGAGKYARVKKGYYFTSFTGELLLGTMSVIAFFFPVEIISFFRNDPAVIQTGTLALRCQCIACLFQPFSVCTNMLFQSIGKSGRASFLSALRSGLYFIPLILILPHFFGLTGVQISQTISDIMACATSIPMALIYLRSLPADKE